MLIQILYPSFFFFFLFFFSWIISVFLALLFYLRLNLGSHYRILPQGSTLWSHLMVPRQDSILRSHLRVSLEGPGFRVPPQGPKSNFLGMLNLGATVFEEEISAPTLGRCLTLFRMGGGGGVQKAPSPFISFSTVSSIKVVISPQNSLTFSFNFSLTFDFFAHNFQQ